MKSIATICPVAALAVMLACAASAFALAGTLDSPGVALPADFPEKARAQVADALTRKDCKFLGGRFVNSITTLRYQGETKALNLFLGDLATCQGGTVHVGFKKLDDDSDWRVSHLAAGNRFYIEVNLNSKQIKLDDLCIPEAKGPVLQKK